MHIGNKIKDVIAQQGRTTRWLAEQIPCERTNAYKILKRSTMDIDLLQRIAQILEYDFFKDLSDETFKGKQQQLEE